MQLVRLTSELTTPTKIKWFCLQFLNQGINTGLYIIWMMLPFSNTSRQNAPGMLCCIGVWRPGWPVHHNDTYVISEGHGQLCGHMHFLH